MFDELSFQLSETNEKSKIVFFVTSYIFSQGVQVSLRQKADFCSSLIFFVYILCCYEKSQRREKQRSWGNSSWRIQFSINYFFKLLKKTQQLKIPKIQKITNHFLANLNKRPGISITQGGILRQISGRSAGFFEKWLLAIFGRMCVYVVYINNTQKA